MKIKKNTFFVDFMQGLQNGLGLLRREASINLSTVLEKWKYTFIYT